MMNVQRDTSNTVKRQSFGYITCRIRPDVLGMQGMLCDGMLPMRLT